MARGIARREALAGLLAALAARGSAAAAPLSRAEAWRVALERAFALNDGTGLYREMVPVRANDAQYTTEWPFSQAHVAYLDLAMIGGTTGERYAAGLKSVRRAQQAFWSETTRSGRAGHLSRVVAPLGKGDELYYDDNEWVGLAEVQHHLFRRDAVSLRHARAIFDLLRSGWSSDATLPSPGGVAWTQDPKNGDRNTVSNMPGAQLGLRLHQITGEAGYLDDALRWYRWTNATLQRADGLYHDHIKRDGTIDRRVWSYNQGVPVGVNVLLAQATGERRYLDEAKRIAEASYDWFVTRGRLDGEPPPFNAIYLKNLLLLEHVAGGTRYSAAMRAYADRMWRLRRDRATGLWQRKGRRAELIDTAAMVQVEAVLAWPRERWAMLY